MERTALRRDRRRLVQGGLALAVLGLLAGCGRPAQRAGVVRVGVLRGGTGTSERPPQPLVDGLREHGYVEGENLAIELRSAEGRLERLPGLAAELVRLPVDVLVPSGEPVVLAARDATATI